jgi:predicted transcriptional regulator
MRNDLKAELARWGITTKEVAGKLGVTTATVRNKVYGRKDWMLGEAGEIVELLNERGSDITLNGFVDLCV